MMYPKPNYIYALFDPRTNEPRYIGKSNDPEDRLRRHLSTGCSRKDNETKRAWLNELVSSGYKPSLVILERVTVGDWEKRERYWIALAKDKEYNLTNVEDGGGYGGWPKTETHKRNIAKGHVGLKHTDESKQKMRLAKLGRKQSPEAAAKSRAHLAKYRFQPRTAEWRRSLRDVNYKLTPSQVREIRDRLALGDYKKDIARDYPVSAATISRIHSGRCYSEVV